MMFVRENKATLKDHRFVFYKLILRLVQDRKN
jgi:hypothetical protein